MAFPASMKHSLSISLSVGAILSGISRRNCKFELSLEAPGQGLFVTTFVDAGCSYPRCNASTIDGSPIAPLSRSNLRKKRPFGMF